MSITETLKEHGGCKGGKLIYASVDKALAVLNIGKSKPSLPAKLRTALDPEFPDCMNLSKVRFIRSANGFGTINFFNRKAEAITIGNLIYFKRNVIWSAQAHCSLLMHELVHVLQYQNRRSSKTAFACDYGTGYVNAGYDYEANPMEKEARDFVKSHFKNFWKRWYITIPPQTTYPHSIWLLQN